MELMVVLMTVAVLATIALPLLANPRMLSERLTCLNNLRQIGHAFQVWGDDHGDRLPWRTPWCADGTSSGGCSGSTPGWMGVVGNVWWHFGWLSNELVTPKILACPGEPGVKVASSFSASPDGGFLNPNYRSSAVSYFVGLDVLPDNPRGVISGDRNVRTNRLSACSAFPGLGIMAPTIDARPVPSIDWLPGLHGDTGNLLFNDGQVNTVSGVGLRQAFTTGDDNGSLHLLMPMR